MGETGKKPLFGQKSPKSGILAKIAHFGHFGAFLSPLGLPRRSFRGWFYINPSRRGPVPVFRGGLE